MCNNLKVTIFLVKPQTSFHMEDSNNSTLRRKLFAGFEDSDDSSCESVQLGEHNRNFPNIGPEDNKENTNISKLIAPGTVLFTPTSTKKNISPDHSVNTTLFLVIFPFKIRFFFIS